MSLLPPRHLAGTTLGSACTLLLSCSWVSLSEPYMATEIKYKNPAKEFKQVTASKGQDQAYKSSLSEHKDGQGNGTLTSKDLTVP